MSKNIPGKKARKERRKGGKEGRREGKKKVDRSNMGKKEQRGMPSLLASETMALEHKESQYTGNIS